MWSFARAFEVGPGAPARAVALVAPLLVLGVGCFETRVCGEPERCNYLDDDCDGRVDEDFVEDGIYFTPSHCGACGVDCAAAFPTGAETACRVDRARDTAFCELVACPPGWHRTGDGSCGPDVPVLCLPCEGDDDCALRVPGARCLETDTGQGRCGQPCGGDGDCPDGFVCSEGEHGGGGQCAPASGVCACDASTEGVELACIFRRDRDRACAGVRVCGPDGLGVCEPVLAEACNGVDDDCDGAVDEDFRDDRGRYVDRLHCGGCAQPCVEPGPNMVATCVAQDDTARVRCDLRCEEGFVDVDGFAANGCECERFDGNGPPPTVGGDVDCDGVPDDSDEFVFVTTSGNDADPGTLARPMRTIQAALERGQQLGKSVLVARGIYDGPFDLVAGVSIFGGYRPDFRDRDLVLFPVVVERRGAPPGSPVITCRGVRAPTRVEGFSVQATDATAAGEGSTAVFLDGCGPGVELGDLTILAGRGADGRRGRSSAERLAAAGIPSLDALVGRDGADGREAAATGLCTFSAGGAGGTQSCFGAPVGGGDGGGSGCPPLGCVNGEPCGNAGCTDFTVDGVCDFEAVLAEAVPNPEAEPGRGRAPGAAGETTFDAPTNRSVCNFCDDNPTLPRLGDDGGDGAAGVAGASGGGCHALPRLDGATGRLVGRGGEDGTGGTHGSGGGGGTAGAGYAVIGGTEPGCVSRPGGSGAGGGSGGCGAPGARGGQGGGASVGILARLAPGQGQGPHIEAVRVVTASGGRGGDGGVGAGGGDGGNGGRGGTASFWCARNGGRGGDGGRGGAGGAGGGGCGGGSHGVVLAGDPTDDYLQALQDGVQVERTGVGGSAGRGGFSPAGPGGDGREGTDEAVSTLPRTP